MAKFYNNYIILSMSNLDFEIKQLLPIFYKMQLILKF